MEAVDTAEWRARMLEQHGLDDNAIEAWFRTGYSPTGIELFYANLKLGIVPKYTDANHEIADATGKPTTEITGRTNGKTILPGTEAKSFWLEIGGRHFSRKDDRMLFHADSAFGIEMWNEMVDANVALVDLHMNLDGKSFVVRGSARRHPDDEPDPELGVSLAVLRALQSLTRRIERQVNGRIKHNDWVAAQKPAVAVARRQRAEAKESIVRSDWDLLRDALNEAGFILVPIGESA